MEAVGKDHFKEWEMSEVAKDQMIETGYPRPASTRRRLVWDTFNASVEETYFWLLDMCRDGMGFPEVIKIVDLFTASEMSSFWGIQQQRIQIQQDQIAKHLGNIGGFVKQLFQMVRELRIIDERLSLYKDAEDGNSKSRNSAESSLKGLYVDIVEGGAKNPSSVLGLGSQLQFTSLPDLFFTMHPVTIDDVDKVIDNLDFNERVKSLLKRKMRSYLTWKLHTGKELKNRRSFMLKYLRHHYNIVQMYINWMKPHLKNVGRLNPNGIESDTPDIVGAFEGSVTEVEWLARVKASGPYYSCLLVNIRHRTRPQMSFQGEGFQRGPIHAGRIDIQIRPYAWTEKDIENYRKMRNDENLEVVGLADGSLKAAMESLGDDLKRYLEEEGETVNLDKEKKKEEPQLTNPFAALIGGFADIGKAIVPVSSKKKPKIDKGADKAARDKAAGGARKAAWNLYKFYKKSHKLVTW